MIIHNQYSQDVDVAFKKEYLQSRLNMQRAVLLLTIISYAVFSLYDGIVAPKSSDILLVYRFAVICPILILIFLFSWTNLYLNLGQYNLVTQSTILGYLHLGLLALIDVSDPGFYSYYAGLILILCGLGIFAALSTVNAFIVSLLIFFGYQYVAIYIHELLNSPQTIAIFIINNLFLATAVAFCILTSYLIESFSRKAFIKQGELVKTLERLKVSEESLIKAIDNQTKWSKISTKFLRHELGNQISSISISLQMIRRVANNSDALKFIERGNRSVVNLKELLAKASEATNIEEALSIFDREEIDISNLMTYLASQYNCGQTQKVMVTTELNFVIDGNEVLLEQLFRNLIDNAVRHATSGSIVNIKVCADGEVIVENFGDSLPDNTDRLFDIWQSDLGKSGLFGLGLFICKKIIMAHEGSIHAENLDNQTGARFVVNFSKNSSPTSIRN